MLSLVRLSVALVELRLGIERIDLTGRAVHEQKDAVLGFGRKVGMGLGFFCGAGRGGEVSILSKKVEKWKRNEPGAGLPQETTARLAAGGGIRNDALERTIHIEARLVALRDLVWSRLIRIDEFVEVENDAAELD